MKILALGELEKGDLRFFKPLDGHDITWFNTIKTRPHAFAWKESRQLIAALKGEEYDLILCGRHAHIKTMGLLRKGLSETVRKVKYPKSFGPSLIVQYARSTPCAVLDMGDLPLVDHHTFPLLQNGVRYFKRELPVNPLNAFLYTSPAFKSRQGIAEGAGPHLHKLRPISIGVDDAPWDEDLTTLPKTADLFYAGNIQGHPIRERGVARLRALADQGLRVDIPKERLDFETFQKRLAAAHLVWSPEGMGWECYRHYEAALAGSVPVMNRPGIQRHQPLQEGVHGLFYDPSVFGELERVVLQGLADKERLKKISRTARNFVLQHHTHQALARHILAETQAAHPIQS
ncbi:MAG: glycosyltransferase [Magnetococcales bacterium]|nr:glycosyltransferase [Magnetococcales bacterium]